MNKKRIETLKVDGDRLYPQTFAQAVYMRRTVNSKIESLYEIIQFLLERTKNSDKFKGAFASLEALEKAVPSPQVGDFAIIAVDGGDDKFVVFDEGQNKWIEKGTIQKIQGITSVNGISGEESGGKNDIILTSKNIQMENLEGSPTIYETVTNINDQYLRFKEAWVAQTEYLENDIVEYNSNLYICSQDHSGTITPDLDTNNWNILAAGDYNKLINVPTKLSQFENDGDGTLGSKFATEQYVETNGGKIDSISVNGVNQTIDESKNVEIKVLTKEEVEAMLPTFEVLE